MGFDFVLAPFVVVAFASVAGSVVDADVLFAGDMKLFMTSRGAFRYKALSLRGCRCDLSTSLQRLYFSTLKWRVGPLGVMASRMFVFPVADREKSMRCVTPSGPVIVV